MRIRNVKNKDEIIENSKYIIKNIKKRPLFENKNEIHLEIGMGKGDFLIKQALKNPNINYIGVEKFSSIIAKAITKIEKQELKNLKLIRCDALELDDFFKNEISNIYLNFSDPWPKERHEKRRLTSLRFLKIYDEILKTKKKIEIKTDNKSLFEYSIVSLNKYGYKIQEIFLDLHSIKNDEITTEYEEKFKKQGKIIYKMIVKK